MKNRENLLKFIKNWTRTRQSQRQDSYYQDKCFALDKDVDLLWKKVRAYEHYGDIERNLKNVAIFELVKAKNKLREAFEAGNKTEEGDIKPNPNREWRKV